jgi:hypothetical protein
LTADGLHGLMGTAVTPLRKSTVDLNPFTLLDNQQVHFKH